MPAAAPQAFHQQRARGHRHRQGCAPSPRRAGRRRAAAIEFLAADRAAADDAGERRAALGQGAAHVHAPVADHRSLHVVGGGASAPCARRARGWSPPPGRPRPGAAGDPTTAAGAPPPPRPWSPPPASASPGRPWRAGSPRRRYWRRARRRPRGQHQLLLGGIADQETQPQGPAHASGVQSRTVQHISSARGFNEALVGRPRPAPHAGSLVAMPGRRILGHADPPGQVRDQGPAAPRPPPGRRAVQASAIAAAEAIPHKFLEAILIQLRHKGLVRSKVGKGGGHALAKAPGEIDILEA